MDPLSTLGLPPPLFFILGGVVAKLCAVLPTFFALLKEVSRIAPTELNHASLKKFVGKKRKHNNASDCLSSKAEKFLSFSSSSGKIVI